MFKKMIFASAILTAAVNVAAADTAPYLGASLGVNVNSSTNIAGNAGVFRGVPVKVFVGYGGAWTDDFFLAAEATATLATGVISNKNDMKTTYGVGVGVLPGYMMTDSSVVFARIGYIRSRFTDVNTMSNGAQVGIGMQATLLQHVDLRGEYDYTSYSSIGAIRSPTTDEFSLAAIYKFD